MGGGAVSEKNIDITRVIPPRRSEWGRLNCGAIDLYTTRALMREQMNTRAGPDVEVIFEGNEPVDIKMHPAEGAE